MKLSKKQLEAIEKDPIIQRIKKSLQEQKAISAKYGFDVGQHWKEMLEHAEKENIKDKKDYGQATVDALRRAKFD